jgi:hypothetical protein
MIVWPNIWRGFPVPEIQLEYRPCDCARYEPSVVPSKPGDEGEPDRGRDAPEFFDREGIAARRLLQLVREGRSGRVHHQGLHVKAVTVDGVRTQEL